jgi:hypothetical protein
MADVNPTRQNIPLPGTQFLAAVSEYIAQSMAGSVNFQNYFAHEEKQFFLNGQYNVGQTLPQLGVDGLAVFEFDAQIIDVWLFNLVAGSSGSTEIDIKVANTSGGSFSSIFTTKPAISYLAGNDAWVGSVDPSLIGPEYSPSPPYSPPSNTTQGVLDGSITNLIPAWSAIRCDLTAVQGGVPENCGILVHYRPI